MTADAVGGVWTYALELIRALPDVSFTLATMGRLPSDAQRQELPENATLVTSEFRLEWEEDPWDDVARAGDWLLELEAREQPDVVHLNGYSHGASPFRAPILVVAHSCVCSWWRAVYDEDAPRPHYREHVERGLEGAALVVAPSAWMLAALDEHYRFTTKRRLIHNGARPQAAHRPERSEGPRVFAAGRLWDEAKNLRTVLAAAPSIRWPVLVAGDGGNGQGAENVTQLGHLDSAAMTRAHAASAIYLSPALYEPFGLSILEAALSGSALILGDIPSLREIWRDAALFVPPRDADAIARTANEVILNPPFREELARRARHRAHGFGVEPMAASYRRTYEELRV